MKKNLIKEIVKYIIQMKNVWQYIGKNKDCNSNPTASPEISDQIPNDETEEYQIHLNV